MGAMCLASLLLGAAPVLVVALVVLVLGTIFVTVAVLADIGAWVHAAAAARRFAMGRPPARRNVDYGIGDDCWTRVLPAADPYRDAPPVELLARGSPIAAYEFLSAHIARRTIPAMGVVGLGTFFTLGVCCPCGYSHADHLETERVRVAAIRSAALLCESEHPGTCPSLDDLRRDKWLDPGFAARDAWGNAYEITCSPDNIVVRSPGPDRRPGTEDDIVVPRP
jgi:hypothetical protein